MLTDPLTRLGETARDVPARGDPFTGHAGAVSAVAVAEPARVRPITCGKRSSASRSSRARRS